MKTAIYFAPLEGITGYVQRGAFQRHFGYIDKYFIPFIQPKQHGHFSNREKQDIQPEHNVGLTAIPQLLTSSAHDFLQTAAKLQELGYSEVNLNLGCPARTVVSKGRGSGQLADLEALQRFLEEIFQKAEVAVSIKTRIGIEDPAEFDALLSIFRQYPLRELIVHPRVQKEFYGGKPHWEAFSAAMAASPFPVCYNGDIFSAAGYRKLEAAFPQLDRVMLGRGLLCNPALAREMQGGKPLQKEEVKTYHDDLYKQYQTILSGDKNILFKMKEFWVYQIYSFQNADKYRKRIQKAQRLQPYEEAVEALLENCEIETPESHRPHFHPEKEGKE